ncbi:MAG: leucine-rich repeat protein [Bacillota bacterium]|nr:leucine-rich repeat protein [Bacillota bacterium]
MKSPKNTKQILNKALSLLLLAAFLLALFTPNLVDAGDEGEAVNPSLSPETIVTEMGADEVPPASTEQGTDEELPQADEETTASVPAEESATLEEQPPVEGQESEPADTELPLDTSVPVEESESADTTPATEDLQRSRGATETTPVTRGGGDPGAVFLYEIIAEGTAVRVTGWTGTETTVTIPETIEGLPVTEITRGDVSSFQARGLTAVSIPKTVTKIGDYAFAENDIATLDIPADSSLVEIGAYAFADNLLTGFTAPSTLRIIGGQAFAQNRLTAISLNVGLESIGNEAFAMNCLTEATVPDSVTSFGSSVFDGNGGRFVKVYTDSSAVPPYENNGPVSFGYVVNPITVTIKYIDQKTRAEVMSSVTLGDDMTDANGVFVKDVEMTYEPPTLSGYYVEPSITFTPDRDGYVLTIEYIPEGPPTLTCPATIRLPEGLTPEEAEARILDAISAVDYTGKDISDRVTVDLSGLDVGTNGFYSITISLTDDYGYEISETVQVQVGAYDWFNHEIGGGWVLGDFTFSADGKTLNGLSSQGITKLRNLPAGARNLVLPAHSYNNPEVPIMAIASQAFYSNIYNVPLETVDFSALKELRTIGSYAFYSYSRPRASAISTVIGFNELTKLESIGDYAFRGTTAAFDLDGFNNLQTIGYSAFASYSTSYQGPTITLGSLPALTRIGASAFSGATVPVADLRGMPNLTGIESSTFYYAKVKEIYFPEVDHNFSIGYQAFYGESSELTMIDFTPIAEHLTSIGSEAFRHVYSPSNLATVVVWPDMPKLSSVGSRIFCSRNLDTSLDLSGSPLLVTIGSNAFEQAGLTGVVLPETVENIGSSAFYNNRITELDFSLLPALKTIGNSAFQTNRFTAVDLSNLASLTSIGDSAFRYNQIESVNLDELPQLKTIGNYAFANNRITDLTFGALPELEVIKTYAFYSNQLASLTIANLEKLKRIENYAFYANRLTDLTISDNPELSSLGNYTFYSNQLAEVTLNNLPGLLELEPYVFTSNPGHDAYYNNVVVWDLPAEASVIPSKANYLVNPDTEEPLTGPWVADDFTYTVTNGEATITGFSEQGAKRFGSGVRPVVFPAGDPDGLPVVGIADYSFANKNIGSIDLTGMTKLRTIGVNAFYNNALSEVSFNGLDSLTEIGNNAFGNNKLTELDLGILPKLTRIGGSAFSGNTISKLKLDGAVSLESIDSSAFQGNRISELNFGYLPKLRLIGSSAFYSQGGDPLSLDLSGLPALESIGSRAFESTNLVSLNFGDLKNLTIINSDAFASHRLTGELDLSGLDALTTIGSDAFECYSSSAYGITNVLFPASGNLLHINNYAFRYNRLTELDLSPLNRLSTIGSYAFAYNYIENIIFPQDPPLTSIGSYAFQSNRLTELDLRPLSRLKYLYYSTFGYNAIGDVWAPDSLTSLNNYTFMYNKLNVGSSVYSEAIIHIGDPTGLSNYLSGGWGHLINPKKLYFTYKDREGNEILPSRTEYYKGSNASETYYAPDMAEYLANPASKTVTFEEHQNEYFINFVYDKLEFFETDAFTLGHTNVGTNRAYVGNHLYTNLTLALSSGQETYENVELRVYYNPEYINSAEVTAPLMGDAYTITKPTDGKPYISFHFPKLVGGQSFVIPVTWAFKTDYTPQDQAEILYTQLRSADNQVLAFATDGAGHPANPTIEAYYHEPYIEKGAVGTNQYNGGPRVAGSFTTTEIEGEDIVHVDVPVDVAYSFRIMQTANTSNFDRNIETITYIDTLPTYQAVEDGQIVTRTAVINLSTSPGWSYYDPVSEMPVEGPTAYGIVTVPNYDKDFAYSYPTLNLQFPGGIKDQTVKNQVEARLTPANRPDGEPIIVTSDDVNISLIAGTVPNPPVYVTVTTLTKTVAPRTVLDYQPTKEAAGFTWPVRFTVGTDDLALAKVFTNVVFEDFALDDRLVYTKVQLPSTGHVAVVKAWRADGTEIEDYGGETSGGVFEFPPYSPGMERIDRITVDLGDREVMTGYSINVMTTFANPSDETADDYAYYDTENHANNYMPNSARVTASYTAEGESGDYSSGTVSDRVQILPFTLKAIPDKTQTFRSSEPGQDPTSQLPHYPGDEGTYTISIKRSLNGRPFTMTDADLPIENFRMVDLLPLDIVVKPEDIRLSAEFAAQPGAGFEMLADYGSTGRVAIIFTADSVAANVTTVASIDAKIDLAMSAGYHKNDLYMSFNTGPGHDWEYGQPVTADDLGDSPENPYMYDYVSLLLVKAQAMNAIKYVRNARLDTATGRLVGTGTWTEGIYTGDEEYFQYRLFVKNDTVEDRDKNEIYDVFPRYLDRMIQMNTQGQRANRGSAFSNRILAARLEGTTADEFRIEYTTDTTVANIPNGTEAGVYLRARSWVPAGPDGSAPEGATAMRIIPKDGSTGMIKKDDTLIVIVDAQAPPYNADTSGRRGYNSFVRIDDSLETFIEVPSVWNEVPTPLGTLRVGKRSRTFDPAKPGVVAYDVPLAGAEFTLYSESGIPLRTAVSNDDGFAVFEDLRVGTYLLAETAVPAGHYEPEESTQIKVERSVWEKQANLVYTVGPFYNEPVVSGTVVIEKRNAAGEIMPGISFALTDTASGDKYMATTGSDGRATFANVPYGAYTLTETNAPRLLAPIAPIMVKIDVPNKVVDYTGTAALRNDRANVALFKLGIRGALDSSKDLSQYTKSDGTVVAESWRFEIRNLTTVSESPRQVNYTSSHVRNGFRIEELRVGDLYEIEELSGPAQTQTVYIHNKTVYQFRINKAGVLVDADGEPFRAQSIYFPNARKTVDGAVVVTKVDTEGAPLQDAVFSLAMLNKATSTFEVLYEANSDADGRVTWDELEPGSYEIREVAAPVGYIRTSDVYRFVVEDFATTSMLTNSSYAHREGGLTHNFSFTAVNREINLSLVKRHLVATNVPEAEKDALLAQNPAYRAVAKPVGYDVYEVLAGATFTLYREVDVNGVKVREVIAENLVSDAEGLISVDGISGFSWDETAIYYLEETATVDDTWLLPEKMLKIDLPAVIRSNPTGVATVFMENQKKVGEILVSKYDRYTGTKLTGITYTLYRGTKDNYLSDPNPVVKKTGSSGYLKFDGLLPGNYILEETATLEGYIRDETLYEIEVTPDNRYFYYYLYNMRAGELLDIPVKKVWLGEVPDYAEGEGLVVELYEGTSTTPMESALLTAEGGWSHTFAGLLKRDNQGRVYTYVIREGAIPAGYEIAVGEGTVKGSSYGLDVTVADEVVLKNHALGDLTVTKTWQERYDELRPAAVVVTLMRAAYNADTGAYGEFTSQGDPVNISAATGWAHTWTGLKTHDVDGRPYRYKVVEAAVTGYQLVAHTPAQVELTGGAEADIELVNRQYLTQKARKAWSDNAPAVKPEIVFQLVRKTDDMTDFELVDGAALKTIPDGSAEVEWNGLPATDEEGNVYTYSVYEGCINDDDEFVQLIPENYRAETTFAPILNEDNVEIGTEIIVTNTWQETSLTATKTWSGNAPTVKPEVELVLRQNGELYNGTGVPVTLQNGDTEASWKKLPRYYYTVDADGTVTEHEYRYSVDEINVPESYDKVLDSDTGVRNEYHSVVLEARKIFDLDLVEEDFAGTDMRPAEIRFSLYKSTYDANTGTTSMQKYDEVVLDGVVDADITDAGEIEEWHYIWNRLPKYYEVVDADGSITRHENEYRVIEEIIPRYYELLGSEDVSEGELFSWQVTNRYRNAFNAHKTWDIGAKTVAGLGGLPSVQLQLYRGIVLDDGTRVATSDWTETVGEPVTLDGQADDPLPGVSRETTQADSLTWTYAWFDLPIYGECTVDSLADYGIANGDRVRYFYYVEEDSTAPALEDYSLDAISSASTLLVNRLDKTDFTAKKEWVDGPVDDRPAVEFVLYADYLDPATNERSTAEEVRRVTLDGVADDTGETGSWTCHFENLRHYVKNADGSYLKDADGQPVLYRYFVKEENVPTDYRISSETDSTITNSYVIPKFDIEVKKTWNGGYPADYERIEFELYRTSAVMTEPELASSSYERVALSETEFAYTFKDMDKTDINGNVYSYFVRELGVVDGIQSIDQNQYSVEIDGLDVSNSYILKLTGVTAEKVWVYGSDENRPDVCFQLWRSLEGGEAEPVPEAEVKRLPEDGTTVVWEDIEAEAAYGRPYTFSVREGVLDSATGVFTEGLPENYNYTVEYDGLQVTNTYVSPPIDIEATKTWVGGENVERPELYFRLMRESAAEIAHPVPGAELLGPFNADASLAWTGVDETDPQENRYRYFVEEGVIDAESGDFLPGTPEHYELGGTALALVNTYVPEIDRVEAEKVWVGGEATIRPTIYFELQRKTEAMDDYEAVPDAAVQELASGVVTVGWDVEIEDASGLPYTFRVVEGDLVGDVFVATAPEKYEAAADGLTITNTYVISRGHVTATKTWQGGSALERPEVFFRLRRSVDGQSEDVPDAELLKLEGDSVTWTDVELETFAGVSYEFAVVEYSFDETTGEYVERVPNYESEVSGLEVTNIFVSPVGDVRATKTWIDGPGREHPVIWFKLFRESELVEREAVPDVELFELADGVTEALWTDLELTDIEGHDYVFTVMEVNAAGEDSTPEHYSKLEEGLHVVNSFVPYSEDPEPIHRTGRTRGLEALPGLTLILAAVLILLRRRRQAG